MITAFAGEFPGTRELGLWITVFMLHCVAGHKTIENWDFPEVLDLLCLGSFHRDQRMGSLG